MAAPNSSEYLEDVEHFYDTDIVNLTSLSFKSFKRQREKSMKSWECGPTSSPNSPTLTIYHCLTLCMYIFLHRVMMILKQLTLTAIMRKEAMTCYQ